jgi:hypothetical protein
MARRKTPTAKSAEPHPSHQTPEEGTRRFRSRGVDVEIRTVRRNAVELKLDGVPIEVEVVDGEFHSQRAHMFASFASIDALVDTLLSNEGRTWTLHGHVCDARCSTQGHHHGGGESHHPGHVHVHDSRSAAPRRRRPAKAGRERGAKR